MQILTSIRGFTYSCSLTIAAWLVTFSALAQDSIYSGGGLEEGVEQATEIVGEEDLREKVVTIVQTVLSYMALAAVVVIILAGVRLIFSQGEEEQKEKAKRTILYALIGLILILLAKGLVVITIEAGGGSVT